MFQDQTDTIVALSTPHGYSGIGVIRMSGPQAVSILKKVFQPLGPAGDFPDRRAVCGRLIDPTTHQTLDDGLAIVMPGPGSYTGEDVAELNLHGSPLVLDLAVRLLAAEGARLAERGEFTRRAFLNGKLDLVQAEAVIDLIEAQSPTAVEDARARLDRALSDEVRLISDALKDLIAELEASIDFDEDDEVPLPDPGPALSALHARMESLRSAASRGRLRRDGVRTVIIGKPNVGKSTLFNALLGARRMIVTPYPGTTRDPVDEQLILEGMRFVLSDTAGIRDEPEAIEEEGIRRTYDRLSAADLLLAVCDGSGPLEEEDLRVMAACVGKEAILVLNKSDLGLAAATWLPEIATAPDRRVALSAHTGEGLAELEGLLKEIGRELCTGGVLSHRGGLTQRAGLLVEQAQQVVADLVDRHERSELPGPDIVCLELRRAVGFLEEITGERADEGLLDRIFERFCIGK